METRRLGRTGLRVSKVCLGTMNFGHHTAPDESFAIMDRAVDAGINFFDTANIYGGPGRAGATETVLGNWFATGGGRRDKVVLATKVYGRMADGPNDARLSARHIRRACEDSLRRLVLNAGGVAQPNAQGRAPITEAGFSAMYAMNVHGHALLVDGLARAGVLAEGATVMFAGSEGSRGIRAMRISAPVLPDGFGDLDATLAAVVRGEPGQRRGYDPMDDYALVKLIGTVWMRQVARDLGLRAFTVSPGFTGGTEAMKNLPTFQRFMFGWVALPLMKLTGNAHHVDVGAARYVQAVTDDALQAGGFYASPKGGISGDIVEQGTDLQPLLGDDAFEAAVGRLVGKQLPPALREVEAAQA